MCMEINSRSPHRGNSGFITASALQEQGKCMVDDTLCMELSYGTTHRGNSGLITAPALQQQGKYNECNALNIKILVSLNFVF